MIRWRGGGRSLTAVIAVTLLSISCSSGKGTTVDVSAAASLTDAFSELASRFEAANPGVDVALNTAGSSTLASQISEGAPADVFASANSIQMAVVVDTGRTADDPVVFATNRLQIVVPSGNPAGVTGLADFADDDLLIGVCAPVVPCGAATMAAFDAAGLEPSPDTEEPDVRSLLAKVVAGDLDAGIVYVTDGAAAGADVETIDVPADLNEPIRYPMVTLVPSTGSSADETVLGLARSFVGYVLSDEGQRVLAGFGFGSP